MVMQFSCATYSFLKQNVGKLLFCYPPQFAPFCTNFSYIKIGESLIVYHLKTRYVCHEIDPMLLEHPWLIIGVTIKNSFIQ